MPWQQASFFTAKPVCILWWRLAQLSLQSEFVYQANIDPSQMQLLITRSYACKSGRTEAYCCDCAVIDWNINQRNISFTVIIPGGKS
jgi:hypothetical protein